VRESSTVNPSTLFLYRRSLRAPSQLDETFYYHGGTEDTELDSRMHERTNVHSRAGLRTRPRGTGVPPVSPLHSPKRLTGETPVPRRAPLPTSFHTARSQWLT
jgi:hypothetical protein